MPIGAVVGAAVVGAGASIYTSSKAAKAQKSAANQASDTTLQVAEENNQLARDMYGENAARLDPYSNMGLAAGDEFMGLLLGHAPTTANAGNGWAPVRGTNTPAATPAPGTGTAATGYQGPSFNDILALKGDGVVGDMGSAINNWISYYKAHPTENPGITPAQIAALKGDGVVGDQEAVQGIYNSYSSRPTTAPPVSAPPVPPTPTPPARTGALAPFAAQGSGTSALAPMADPAQVAAQAHQAIAAGADPHMVAQRASQYGVRLQ